MSADSGGARARPAAALGNRAPALYSASMSIASLQKRAKGGDKEAKFELSVMEKILPVLENAGMIRSVGLDKDELQAIKSYNFLTLKKNF